jgi:hypothetical protein
MTEDHPLARILDDAARGHFPEPDGGFEVLPALSGIGAMIGFTAHFVLAADIAPAAVAARVEPGDLSVPMSAEFLSWIAEQTGGRPATFDALLCALGTGAGAPSWLAPAAALDHPRVERAARYRRDMRIWTTAEGDGVVIVGRGICGRWELGFEVNPTARGRGLGRELASAARGLVPAGEPLWAQVAPGNAASLRATLAGGFAPIAAEVLFPRA